MNNLYVFCLAASLMYSCGDSSVDACGDGLVSEGGRCVTYDGGRADGCLSEELCNGEDDDCDGSVDEGLAASVFYGDTDADGAGDPAIVCEACDVSVCEGEQPEVGAWADENNDCDDTCETCFPGAPELCDVLDNDCDALTDEAASNTYYVDVDGDGHGVMAGTCTTCDPAECEPLEEGTWVEDGGDCDDTCETCFPGGAETCDDLDNDCDGLIDEGAQTTFYADVDGDTHGDPAMPCLACEASECGAGDWSTLNDDCDDTCETCFPGGTEVCDELDNDCSGVADSGLQNTFYYDADGDGFGTAVTRVFCGSSPPVGWARQTGDCADHDSRAHPGAGALSTPIFPPSPPGGPFDFDCDGAEEPEYLSCFGVPRRCISATDRRPSCFESGTVECGAPLRIWSCVCDGMKCNETRRAGDQECR